jgi:hypothetical protein
MKKKSLILSLAALSCLLITVQSNAWWGRGGPYYGYGWGGPVAGTVGLAADIATLGAVGHHHRAAVDNAYDEGYQRGLAEQANSKKKVQGD